MVLVTETHNNICVIAAKQSSVISQLMEIMACGAATVRHISDTHSDNSGQSQTYNTVIVFHEQEIKQDTHLVDFASMLDTEKLVRLLKHLVIVQVYN